MNSTQIIAKPSLASVGLFVTSAIRVLTTLELKQPQSVLSLGMADIQKYKNYADFATILPLFEGITEKYNHSSIQHKEAIQRLCLNLNTYCYLPKIAFHTIVVVLKAAHIEIVGTKDIAECLTNYLHLIIQRQAFARFSDKDKKQELITFFNSAILPIKDCFDVTQAEAAARKLGLSLASIANNKENVLDGIRLIYRAKKLYQDQEFEKFISQAWLPIGEFKLQDIERVLPTLTTVGKKCFFKQYAAFVNVNKKWKLTAELQKKINVSRATDGSENYFFNNSVLNGRWYSFLLIEIVKNILVAEESTADIDFCHYIDEFQELVKAYDRLIHSSSYDEDEKRKRLYLFNGEIEGLVRAFSKLEESIQDEIVIQRIKSKVHALCNKESKYNDRKSYMDWNAKVLLLVAFAESDSIFFPSSFHPSCIVELLIYNNRLSDLNEQLRPSDHKVSPFYEKSKVPLAFINSIDSAASLYEFMYFGWDDNNTWQQTKKFQTLIEVISLDASGKGCAFLWSMFLHTSNIEDFNDLYILMLSENITHMTQSDFFWKTQVEIISPIVEKKIPQVYHSWLAKGKPECPFKDEKSKILLNIFSEMTLGFSVDKIKNAMFEFRNKEIRASYLRKYIDKKVNNYHELRIFLYNAFGLIMHSVVPEHNKKIMAQIIENISIMIGLYKQENIERSIEIISLADKKYNTLKEKLDSAISQDCEKNFAMLTARVQQAACLTLGFAHLPSHAVIIELTDFASKSSPTGSPR